MTTDLINEQLLSDDIYIDSSELKSGIDDILLVKLKDKFEGKTITSGYIIKDTIVIVGRSKYGKCIGNNKISYNVNYKTVLVSPVIGLNIDCYINNITKAGVVAYIKLNDYGKYEGSTFEDSPLLILIPLSRFEDKNININDKIKIEITAVRTKYNNKTIQIIGRPK
uniref:S1 motif domain-containing protein n=1 Tax=viral metagenome TaxID=1070528 RepID=A0A6C0CY75_9ZZZZ